MACSTNVFAELAARARSGDASARREFRVRFAAQAVRIVRQTLRSGAVATPFARRIVDEARRVVGGSAPDCYYDADALIHQVAEAMTDWVVAGLEPAATPSDAARETVCNL